MHDSTGAQQRSTRMAPWMMSLIPSLPIPPCRRLSELESQHTLSLTALQSQLESALERTQHVLALEQAEISAAAWADAVMMVPRDNGSSSSDNRQGAAVAVNAGSSDQLDRGSGRGSGLPSGPSTPARQSLHAESGGGDGSLV